MESSIFEELACVGLTGAGRGPTVVGLLSTSLMRGWGI